MIAQHIRRIQPKRYPPQAFNAEEAVHSSGYKRSLCAIPSVVSKPLTVLRFLVVLVLASSLTKASIADAAEHYFRTTVVPIPKAVSQKTSPEDVTDLVLGQTVERQVSPGQIHYYRITLNADEYINVEVDRQRSDVVAQVLDPAGNTIAETDHQLEGIINSLWMLAEKTGDYRIKITAPRKKTSYKTYTIKLSRLAQWQSAPSTDQDYVKAHRLAFDADQIRKKGGDQSLRQAIQLCQEAIQIWRNLRDDGQEAATLHDLAFLFSEAGDAQNALALYGQAVTLWQKLNNQHAAEASTFYNMGSLYSGLGNPMRAIDCFKKANELMRLRDDPDGQAHALTNMGQAYINLGEFEAALNTHREALRLQEAVEDNEGEARSLSNISGVYFSLGEFQEALNYCKKALPLRRVAGDRRGEAITLSNIGSNYRELGEPRKALEYSRHALSILSELGDKRGETKMLDVVGRDYYELGNYQKALEYHNRSLQAGLKDANREASTLANIGRAYAKMGERQKAVDYFEQSLKLMRTIGDRLGEAITLQYAGELYEVSGDINRAREYFDEGLSLSREIKNRFLEANLLYDLARLEKRTGHATDARSRVEAAIAIVESTRSRVASTDLRASLLASKQDFYELEIELLMQSYRRNRDQESLVNAFIVSEGRRARSLFDSLDEGRAGINKGVLPELRTRESVLRAKLNQKAELHIKLLSGKHTQSQADSLSKELETITNDYDQVLAEIRASNPRYAALVKPAPVTLKELQTEILDPDTLLLEFSLGEEKSYLWATTSKEIAGYELPGRSEIEVQARNIYGLLTERNRFIKFEKPDERQARFARADAEYYKAASRLSRLLLQPVASMMKGKRLVIVSDGALQYLPFAALPSPVVNPASETAQSLRGVYRPLIADHEITSLPSASILGLLQRDARARKPAPRSVAVLADPVFSKTDQRVATFKPAPASDEHTATSIRGVKAEAESESEFVRAVEDVGPEHGLEISRLPFTRLEANAILSLIAKADRFQALDFDANRAAATNPELSQYRIVHFATHGLLNTTHPGLSGLILSLVDRQGNDQNGFLPAHEIFNLNLPADLVVLSGCKTGLGKEIRGEGLLGLTRGFMYAGATRVAVSLWDINDKSTAELMTRFYGGMLGKSHLSPAAALKQAQVAMWRSTRWSAPYYWAAFVVQGEYH